MYLSPVPEHPLHTSHPTQITRYTTMTISDSMAANRTSPVCDGADVNEIEKSMILLLKKLGNRTHHAEAQVQSLLTQLVEVQTAHETEINALHKTLADLEVENCLLKANLDAALDKRGKSKAECGNKLLNIMISNTKKTFACNTRNAWHLLRENRLNLREEKLRERERVVSQITNELADRDVVDLNAISKRLRTVLKSDQHHTFRAEAEEAKIRLEKVLATWSEWMDAVQDMFKLLKSVSFDDEGSIKSWLETYESAFEHVEAPNNMSAKHDEAEMNNRGNIIDRVLEHVSFDLFQPDCDARKGAEIHLSEGMLDKSHV